MQKLPVVYGTTTCCSVIPIHKNEDLGKELLKSTLNDLEISAEQLISMLKLLGTVDICAFRSEILRFLAKNFEFDD
jgi:hypothetical protein